MSNCLNLLQSDDSYFNNDVCFMLIFLSLGGDSRADEPPISASNVSDADKGDEDKQDDKDKDDDKDPSDQPDEPNSQ